MNDYRAKNRASLLLQNKHHIVQSNSRLWATNNYDDGIGDISNNSNENEEYYDEEDEFGGIKSHLSKISWLPNVNLGKQPYKPPNPFSSKLNSRKESITGQSYEQIEFSTESKLPGDEGGINQKIEILPVLPMAMVHGLEGINLDEVHEEEEEEGSEDEENADSKDTSSNPYSSDSNSYYGTGVWEEGLDDALSIGSSTLGPLFSGTSSYLPHTKGHVFTVAEPRYKKLYDDLLRMGNYYGRKRDSAIRRANGEKQSFTTADPPLASSLPDPDEKRRFIVTAANPAEDGVFAEYGLLFQLKDLDEVAAVASYEMGGEDGSMTIDELQQLVESHRDVMSNEYGDSDEMMMGDGEDDIMEMLLRTHYEATHDVVGRVKIHRFVNPECYSDGFEGDEYLMAEATILDVVENDRAKMLSERKRRRKAAATQEVEEPVELVRKLEGQKAKEQTLGDVADAVARIKDELRSSVSEAFKHQQQQQYQQQGPQLDADSIKEKLRSALDETSTMNVNKSSNDGTSNTSPSSRRTIPLGPKGIYVEKRSDDSLSKEERALRESFAKLVALQHELKEECRFTRVSVQTFGVGPVGVWLSAAAWSQFVAKRLESTHGDMQSDLQSRLVEFLSERGSSSSDYFLGEEGSMEGAETIDFEDLSLDLQQEFQLVQARATEELGPLALERAIQMQRIVQANSYTERLDLLRECVDNERRRLEAKKMLKSLAFGGENEDGNGSSGREEARSFLEKLMSQQHLPKDPDDEAFQ